MKPPAVLKLYQFIGNTSYIQPKLLTSILATSHQNFQNINFLRSKFVASFWKLPKRITGSKDKMAKPDKKISKEDPPNPKEEEVNKVCSKCHESVESGHEYCWKCGTSLTSNLDRRNLLLMAGGATAAVVAAPIVISAAGFGASGIAAGSLAAKLMSLSWTTGVGVGAIGTLQSIGAAGMGAASTAVAGGTGAAAAKGAKTVAEWIKPCKTCKEGQICADWIYCPVCGKEISKK